MILAPPGKQIAIPIIQDNPIFSVVINNAIFSMLKAKRIQLTAIKATRIYTVLGIFSVGK